VVLAYKDAKRAALAGQPY